jgi:glycosyltransferase involved in cell wall biosynthesis
MAAVFLYFALLMGCGYALLMALYLIGWRLQQQRIVPKGYVPTTRISVIIPARNEAANIRACIDALLAQQYPVSLFEVIVVDDCSEDETAGIVTAYGLPQVRVIALAPLIDDHGKVTAFKKLALGAGIAAAHGELIITTDADCTARPDWLRAIAHTYEQQGAKMIIAPVDFTCNGSLVELFQAFDFRTMQGITGAAHALKLGHMANGANLAFSKAAFLEIDGYEGTRHIASGDDYLLLVKMADYYPDAIAYLKSREAIVHTAPQPGWKALLNQRARWASKSGRYKDHRLTAILIVVYLFNVSLLLLFLSCLFVPGLFRWLGCLAAGKILLELLFLIPVSQFFGKMRQLVFFPFLQPLHILYICLAGFLGYTGKYEWKGRNIQ